jgi:hypothetical protein
VQQILSLVSCGGWNILRVGYRRRKLRRGSPYSEVKVTCTVLYCTVQCLMSQPPETNIICPTPGPRILFSRSCRASWPRETFSTAPAEGRDAFPLCLRAQLEPPSAAVYSVRVSMPMHLTMHRRLSLGHDHMPYWPCWPFRPLLQPDLMIPSTSLHHASDNRTRCEAFEPRQQPSGRW